jgi:hypothetical protein
MAEAGDTNTRAASGLRHTVSLTSTPVKLHCTAHRSARRMAEAGDTNTRAAPLSAGFAVGEPGFSVRRSTWHAWLFRAHSSSLFEQVSHSSPPRKLQSLVCPPDPSPHLPLRVRVYCGSLGAQPPPASSLLPITLTHSPGHPRGVPGFGVCGPICGSPSLLPAQLWRCWWQSTAPPMRYASARAPQRA